LDIDPFVLYEERRKKKERIFPLRRPVTNTFCRKSKKWNVLYRFEFTGSSSRSFRTLDDTTPASFRFKTGTVPLGTAGVSHGYGPPEYQLLTAVIQGNAVRRVQYTFANTSVARLPFADQIRYRSLSVIARASSLKSVS